jgi:selenoprotein W-related protein
LAEEILGEREIEAYVRSWTMVPSTGGVFDVVVNGEKVFSKKELGRHAEPGEIKAAVVERLEKLKPAATGE